MKRLLLALLLTPALMAYANPVPLTLGAEPVVQSGEVSGFDFRAYRFSARAGQYYHVQLDNKDVDFSLLPLQRGAAIPSGAEGYIPADGEYELRILQNREAAQGGQTSRFQLTLTVNDGQSETADAGSMSSEVHFHTGSIGVALNGRLQGQAEDRFRFYGNAGQRLRTQVSGENLIVSLHYLGRGQDNLNAAEQILPAGGQYELRVALNRASARRNRAADYQVDMQLDSVAAAEMPRAPMTTQAVTQTPPALAATPAMASPAAPAANSSLFKQYQCADGSSYKVHYGGLDSDEARATFYLGETQHHLSWSKRHSTPMQAVFYGKNHYLTLNTPTVEANSQILSFSKRDGEAEQVLAANCIPQ